jgi:hypothetical protein
MHPRCSRSVVTILPAVFTVVALAASPAFAQSEQAGPAFTRHISVNFAPESTSAFGDAERALTASVITPRPTVSLAARQGTQASQEDEGIGVGVLGMITRTSFRGDEGEGVFDLDNKTGYGFGLWVGGNRNGRVGFVGEFIYLVRGDDEFRTKALQIPAVFHVNFGSRSRNNVGGYVVVGPSFTINLKQEAGGIDVSDDFNGADIGIIGGLGVEFFRIGLEGRGNWGLRSISSEGDVADSKTFTFEFLAKFAFN